MRRRSACRSPATTLPTPTRPDYIRQRLLQTPQLPQQQGDLILGLGVKVDGVEQVIDKFLQERLRNATSDVASSDAQADAYSQLEVGDQRAGRPRPEHLAHVVLRQPARCAQSAGKHLGPQRGRAEGPRPDGLDSAARSARFADSSDVNQRDHRPARTTSTACSQTLPSSTIRSCSSKAAASCRATPSAFATAAAGTRPSWPKSPTSARSSSRPATSPSISGGDFLVSRGTYRRVTVVTPWKTACRFREFEIAELNAPLTSGGGRLGGLLAARDTCPGGIL